MGHKQRGCFGRVICAWVGGTQAASRVRDERGSRQWAQGEKNVEQESHDHYGHVFRVRTRWVAVAVVCCSQYKYNTVFNNSKRTILGRHDGPSPARPCRPSCLITIAALSSFVL